MRHSNGANIHLDSTDAAAQDPRPDGFGDVQTFLWRTRDLAAWGVASSPRGGLGVEL